MKKNKNIAFILVIIGGLLATTGIIINNFMPEKEKSGQNHVVEEKDLCDSIVFDEKSKFVITQNISEEYSEYLLATTAVEFEEAVSLFEYDLEEIYLDHSSFDYLIYYVNDGNLCNRSKYLTNYSINNNIINIEFTKNEFNTNTCDYNTIYGYVIEIEKGLVDNNVVVNVTTKEDPYKECYK